jgi:hypothetical protein
MAECWARVGFRPDVDAGKPVYVDFGLEFDMVMDKLLQ